MAAVAAAAAEVACEIAPDDGFIAWRDTLRLFLSRSLQNHVRTMLIVGSEHREFELREALAEAAQAHNLALGSDVIP